MTSARWQRRAASAARRLDPRQESGAYRDVSDPDLGTYTSIPLTRLGRRNPTKEQRDEAGIAADSEAIVWCLLAEELGATVPKVGGQVVGEDGSVWTVRVVSPKLFATRYHLTCIKVG